MKSNGVLVRVMALLGATAVLLLAFHLFVRPWYLQWGATGKEAREPLVGDRIVANAASQETRAITIHAGVQQVWPWLAQLGQDRGGFYSFDILENLAGCEMPTTDGLRPDRQSWQEGDKLWMYPSNKAGGAGFATLRDVVPGRALGFGTHMVGTPIQSPENGSWSFALEPIGAAATRLLIRGRGATGRSPSETAFDMFLFEPLHFMMERRMMIGVKELAEGSDRGRLWNHLLVALFADWVRAMVRRGGAVPAPERLAPVSRRISGSRRGVPGTHTRAAAAPRWAGTAGGGGRHSLVAHRARTGARRAFQRVANPRNGVARGRCVFGLIHAR